jgi:hypothetical protein
MKKGLSPKKPYGLYFGIPSFLPKIMKTKT